ncbi:YkvA family protein [Erwinia pyri]|uniref:YkvA family protein n=1 Tax=Erwinia pyri TaxID=3062598 RepID=A0AA50DM20_9GAMM|nr:YkvA family protein [Erwinia sp. DE2]WLS80232.1 YkvA family protein [Erwinia sp. DE2]
MFGALKRWARLIKKDVLTLWFACRDPRTPLWLKVLAGALVAYAFSPIDLIPDFIPIIGLLDDAIIVPLGVMLLLRLLPKEVKKSSQARAEIQRAKGKKITSWFGMAVIVAIWIAVTVYLIHRYSA